MIPKSFIITGYFTDNCRPIPHRYDLYISRVEETDIEQRVDVYDIRDHSDVLTYDDTKDTICWSDIPVTLSCDYQDTFSHVIVKSAQVNFVTNFNLKDVLLAYNTQDVSIRISEHQSGSVLFEGYIEPLCFSEPYAYNWNIVEVSANDKMSGLQYIKFPSILTAEQLSGELSPKDIIEIIYSQFALDPLDEEISYENLDEEVEDAMEDTVISSKLWMGDSKDDWMTCFEVLEQLGKYFNVWFLLDGTKLSIFDWHNETRNTTTTLQANDYCGTDTNISNSDAYTQIRLSCSLEEGDEILNLTDNLTSMYDNYAKYMEEYIAEGCGSGAQNAFLDLIVTGKTQKYGDKNEAESYKIQNFCDVKESTLWDFGENSYKDYARTHTQQEVLQWLLNEGKGKAAFVSFGRTDKQKNDDNSPINSIELKDYLAISVCGVDNLNDQTAMMNRINSRAPLCSFSGSSQVFTPADSDTTNYLVISGSMKLNKLFAQSGVSMHGGKTKKVKDGGGSAYDKVNGNLYLDYLNCYELTEYWIYNEPVTYANQMYHKAVPRMSKNEYGAFYNQLFYNGAGGEELPWKGTVTPTQNGVSFNAIKLLYGELDQDVFEKTWQYTHTFIDNKGKEIDSKSKVAVLECELMVGDKYCVERLDKPNGEGWGEFEWLTEEEIIAENIKLGGDTSEFYWKHFTIGFDPKLNDYFIGQEHEIQNNIWYYQHIDGKGTAIPIHFDDNLHGQLQFKIIGPINLMYQQVDAHTKRALGFLWKTGTSWTAEEMPVLEKIQSILISNLKIELKTDNGNIIVDTDNSDIVYASDMNDKFIDNREDETKLCTMLTSREAADKNVRMIASISHVYNSNGSIFYGYDSGETDENNQTIYIKPEELYVDGFYREYCKPRTMLGTTIKLRNNYNIIQNPTKYVYNVSYLDGNFVPVEYEADLKHNAITLNMKDMTEIEININD